MNPNAPYIEDRPECPDCENRIRVVADHAQACPLLSVGGKEKLAEYLHEKRAR